MTRGGPPLPRSTSEFPPEEVPTGNALLLGDIAICGVCHGGGRVTLWKYVRTWCDLCDGAGFVPAAVDAEWRTNR